MTNLNKFVPITFEDCLAQCKYFIVQKYEINGEKQLFVDEKSFQCVTCVKGGGFIENIKINQGDSFFIPASYGNYTIDGELEIVSTKV